MLSSHYTNILHALTKLYPSRHALIIAKHLKLQSALTGLLSATSNRPLRAQVAADLLANSNTRLPSVDVARPPDFTADAFMGTSYQTKYFRVITRPHAARPPNLTDDMFMRTCNKTKCLPAITHPHYLDTAKPPISQRIPQIVVSLLNSPDS